jgi:NCS2 family nucleobase:cation symporter-2/xanthine permease XanP
VAATGMKEGIRYERDDDCPWLVAVAVGAQGVLIAIAPAILVVAITALAAGQDEHYLSWAVFAALIIGGIITALQAAGIGWLGTRHILITGTTPNFVAVSVLALEAGGPATLASLTVLSSLFYLAIAAWLPRLRRIITPAVSGTVLMLIATMILPVATDRFTEVPEGTPALAGPGVALLTVVVIAVLALRAPARWRLWSPLIGIGVGCVVAAALGMVDLSNFVAAPWSGIPTGGLPGIELTLSAGSWALLPMFLIVTLVQAIKTIGDAVVVQQVSQRVRRSLDFRLVQGALFANGAGIFLSGLAGTPPTSAYSSSTVSLIGLTGVAARRVAYAIGVILVLLAFFPKFTGLLLAIPNPVMGAFLMVAIALLFIEGLRTVARAGIDQQTALVVGLSFSVGAGLQFNNIFTGTLAPPWDSLLGNGITVGAAVAIALTVLLDLTGGRRRRLETRLDSSELPRIDSFLQEFAARLSWGPEATDRLRSAGEEALISLSQAHHDLPAEEAPRLIIVARPEDQAVEIEFLAVFAEENLEDRLAHLDEQSEISDARELSFRLLYHYASAVRHQKYHGLDIVTVRVDA